MDVHIELIQGDCLKAMDKIADKSIDMILCDLPYGRTANKWDRRIPLPILWSQYNRIIKDNGAVIMFAQTPFDKVLGCSNLNMLRYEWIWEKPTVTGFLNANRMPMKAHENILVFYKKLPVYNPQKTTGHTRKVSKAEHKKGSIKSTNYGDYKTASYDSTERYPRDVQVFSTDRQKEALHPTQKPVALLEYLIKTYTNENEIVLDSCMGSGATGVACKHTGRNFIGIELDKEYFSIAKQFRSIP